MIDSFHAKRNTIRSGAQHQAPRWKEIIMNRMSTPFAEVIHFGNSDVITTSSDVSDDGKSYPDAISQDTPFGGIMTFLESEMREYNPNATFSGNGNMVVNYNGYKRTNYGLPMSKYNYMWYNSKDNKWYTESKKATDYGSLGNLPR